MQHPERVACNNITIRVREKLLKCRYSLWRISKATFSKNNYEVLISPIVDWIDWIQNMAIRSPRNLGPMLTQVI